MYSTDLASMGFGREIFEPEHEAYRDLFRKFMKREIEPNVKEWEKQGFFPAEVFKKAGEIGLLGPFIAEEYGGVGGDFRYKAVHFEEHAYSPAGAAFESGLTTDCVIEIIQNQGTEEQKKEYLPHCISGELIVEIALSEPGAGSDVRGIITNAKRDGDDYVLNGQKAWVSNGPILTHVLIVAKTSEKEASVFIVPIDTKGVFVSSSTELMMRTCGGVSDIFLDNVRIPKSFLLGAVEGNGFRAGLKTLSENRVIMGSRATATSELALAMTVDYVKGRKAFGQRIIDFQNTQFKLATMAAEITASRYMSDTAMHKLLHSGFDAAEAAKVRLFTTEVTSRVMDECLQLHGGMGFTNEMPISKMYTFSRVFRMFGGSSEIMRLIISRDMMS